MAKLTLGQEAYYEQQVARGLDDYHAGRGESHGIWAGSGSAGLGLVGVLDDGDPAPLCEADEVAHLMDVLGEHLERRGGSQRMLARVA